jgi:hypothetical protein
MLWLLTAVHSLTRRAKATFLLSVVVVLAGLEGGVQSQEEQQRQDQDRSDHSNQGVAAIQLSTSSLGPF